MADQRSVMKEYRLLEQKQLSGALSAAEEARFAQLRDLVGPDSSVGGTRPGFDVNAAAARLRESLLPAGLRNRPPPVPEPVPEPAAPPAPEGAAGGEGGLEAVWNAAPFAPLAERPGLSEDSLFDPESLATDAASAPAEAGEPQPYDPNAQPYDPNAPQQWDQGAQGWDPNAQPYDPSAQPYDPNAPQQWDQNAQGWDANAQPDEAGAPAADAGAAPQWEQAVQPAWDPNLAAPWGEAPAGEPAAELGVDLAAAPSDSEAAGAEWGAGLPAPEAAAGPEAQWSQAEGAAGVDSSAWDASALPPEEAAPFEPAAAAEPAPEPAFEEGLPPPPEAMPAPALDPAMEALLGAASAVGGGVVPEGWGSEPPSVEFEAPATEPAAGEADYGDLAGAEAPAQVDALPSEEAQSLVAPLGAGQELTSEDDAFAQGFHLESNGSFGQEAPPAQPAWSEPQAPSETEAWESAPSLDLGAMSVAPEVPPLDLAPIAPEETTASLGLAPPPAPIDALDEIDVEEVPVLEADALEPVIAPPAPAAAIAPPPPPPPPPAVAPVPTPAAAPVAAAPLPPPPRPAPPADLRVEGTHRVVVHTLEGLVKRGVIADARLDSDSLSLAPQPDAAGESLPTAKVKAIFFMLAAGEKAPAAEGKKVRVTFNDGRQIAGFSPDYSDAGAGFFMVPADTRTNTGRIWVYRAAVKSVTVS